MNTLDQADIREILPQSDPFLFIDKVLDFQKGIKLNAVKNITADEWMFSCYGNQSVALPATILIEAAAQAALILYHLTMIESTNRVAQYRLGRIKADIFDEILVGGTLEIEAFANKILYSGGYSEIIVSSENKKLAVIEIIYTVTDLNVG